MIHACTAQAFLCLTVVMAAALSPWWQEPAFPTRASRQGVSAVKVLAWTLVGSVYCQLMIGAVVRHLHAGLSIPDFPLAFGQIIPPMLNERVAIHFAHRVGALVVTLLMVAVVVTVFTAARRHARLRRAAIGLVVLVAAQVLLGACVIWTARAPVITSLHVVNGAAVLATALLLAMRASKLNSLLQPESRTWSQAQFQEAHA
jgi:cytochrome c oxidase assembly protein subunit 15